MIRFTRRDFAMAVSAALVTREIQAQTKEAGLITRAIPATGELLPAVGLGTAYVFDRSDERTRQAAAEVVRTLIEGGGRLIDTASTYGDAEDVLGTTINAQGVREKIFIATKLEAPDPAELKRSLARLKTAKLDLLQLHNVSNARQSLAQFKTWKEQGICRYIGVTSTFHRDFAAMGAVIARERPDFVQVDYSIDDREAQQRILPVAAEVKAAVLTAQPFGRGRLFRIVRGKPVPQWASGFAATWAQFFLKYLLADERVTAVIPGTSNPAHMTENLCAMHGVLPDPDQRRQMETFVQSL
jgi:aryl-alcohol dehydrogenase-like predicted oxidoreductase